MNIDWRCNKGWGKIHVFDYLTKGFAHMKCGRKYDIKRYPFHITPCLHHPYPICPDCEKIALLMELGE